MTNAQTRKRKRALDELTPSSSPAKHPRTEATTTTTIQLAIGTYERVLHGVTISIPPQQKDQTDNGGKSRTENATFSDSFLLNAHASSIRCLAVSPPSQGKVILASGSADERINLYQLSSTTASLPPHPQKNPVKPVNPAQQTNKELGALTPHNSTITSLIFPTHSKLLSTSLDNTLAIHRTRDWSTLSVLRAPHPPQPNRPSGDTSALNDAPGGISDLAVHPSARVGVSVGVGERCLRLWDLVRGRRVCGLEFDKGLCGRVGGGVGTGRAKWRAAEGRSVCWSPEGGRFAVAFERGCAVFETEGWRVVGVVGVERLGRRGKVGKIRFCGEGVLVVSTEDGRVLFFGGDGAEQRVNGANKTSANEVDGKKVGQDISDLPLLAQLAINDDAKSSANRASSTYRIKDFILLDTPTSSSWTSSSCSSPPHHEDPSSTILIITGSSDGALRVWALDKSFLSPSPPTTPPGPNKVSDQHTSGQNGTAVKSLNGGGAATANAPESPRGVGTLLGEHQTGRRILCLAGFVMDDDATAAARDFLSPAGEDGAEVNGDGEDGLLLHEGEGQDDDGSESESKSSGVSEGEDGNEMDGVDGEDDERRGNDAEWAGLGDD